MSWTCSINPFLRWLQIVIWLSIYIYNISVDSLWTYLWILVNVQTKILYIFPPDLRDVGGISWTVEHYLSLGIREQCVICSYFVMFVFYKWSYRWQGRDGGSLTSSAIVLRYLMFWTQTHSLPNLTLWAFTSRLICYYYYPYFIIVNLHYYNTI